MSAAPILTYNDIPSSLRKYVRIGTCSWKYESWKGLIYPEDYNAKKGSYLEEYSKFYNTVEVDQWFWSLFPPDTAKLPIPDVVKAYADATPKDFTFSIKVPNSITLTHFYKQQTAKYKEYADKKNPIFLSVELFKKFLDALSPLEGKIGPLMFQFEYLNKQKMASLEMFMDLVGDFIRALPSSYQYALEIRNPNYLNKQYFDFLRELKIAHVLLEGYYMPPIADVFKRNNTVTANFAVIRLHGADRGEIEAMTEGNWNKIVIPKPDTIKNTVDMILELIKKKIIVTINSNNHFEGSSVQTNQQLIEELKKSVE
jgi:uncharacterized protein YecE (DUF72 family)